MKWRLALLIIVMLTVTMPAMAESKPPVKHLFPVLMGLHNPDSLAGKYGYNEFGFALAITNHYAIHYEDGSLGACIVLRETTGDGFEDMLWLHIKVENLLTGETQWLNWQQSLYEVARDKLQYGCHGTRCDYAKIVSPMFLLKHARITLYPTTGNPVLQYCQW